MRESQPIHPEVIRELIAPLKAAPIWKVEKGYGTVLCLDAGSKRVWTHRDGSPYDTGEYHLMVDSCDWVLGRDREEIANSSELDAAALLRIHDLRGASLQEISYKSGKARLTFSGGFWLDLRGYEDNEPDDDVFLLFLPGDRVLTCKRAGLYLKRKLPGPSSGEPSNPD